MADVTINYRASSIATMNSSGSVLLETQGKYCDSDLEVVYVSPGGGGANLQSGAGYSNGTYYPDTGYDGFSDFEVDVPNTYTQADEGKVVSSGALVSQSSQTITDNGTYDTTLKNSVTVSVSTSATVDKKTKTLSASAGYITFDNLKGEPTTFVVISGANLATATAAKAAVCLYDGTDTHGLIVTNTSNANCSYSSAGYSPSYSNGSLTIISSGADFQANEYKLVYSYNNTSSDIHVDGVQVGSGATSISFTGLTAEPEYFTVMFTGSFGTSSGYTRTMAVVFDGSSTYGMEMGTGAVASTNWSYTYSSGTLTVSSTSSSAGGYFHQPGYYELCAVYGSGGGASLGTKSITANGTYNASSDGYDGYSSVTVNVSGGITWDDLATAAVPNGDVTLTTTSIEDFGMAYLYGGSPGWKLYGPNVTYIGQSVTRQDPFITEIHFPNLSSTHATGYLFRDSNRLELVDYGSASPVRANSFNSCTAFNKLILRKSTEIQTLAATGTFDGTCFKSGGTGGTIYIPTALYNHLGDGTSLDYQAASNWSTIYSRGVITWAKLEGSIYE